MDGNDKLKPYGFEIHGCIDGYSRKVLWIKIMYSNKDSRTVIYHYLVTVKNINGFPRRVKADRGVENSVKQAFNAFFGAVRKMLMEALFSKNQQETRELKHGGILRKHSLAAVYRISKI